MPESGSDLALAVLRVAIGLVLAAHGAQKVFGVFEGPGLEKWRGAVAGMGFAQPRVMGTLAAFLAWFGGTGYLLTRHSHFVALVSLAISTFAGLFAGWLVFKFMVKLMISSDAPLSNDDYRIEGSVGTLSMPIREKGTGEIIFSLAGVRRCAGARSDDGHALEKGAEVVIERYEKGIAYVKRWDDFTK